MVGHGGSSAGSYLTDSTSPVPSHCAVIIVFNSDLVHQLSNNNVSDQGGVHMQNVAVVRV